MKNSFGMQIRAARKQAGMTQHQLASGIITKSMLSQIENGNASPSLKTLSQLAERLRLPVSNFVGGDHPDTDTVVSDDRFFKHICETLATVDSMLMNACNEAKALLDQTVQSIGLETNVLSSAELLKKAGKDYLILSDFESAQQCFMTCRRLYEANKLFIQAAEAHLETRHIYMDKYDTAGCFTVFREADSIYSHALNTDTNFEIKLLYLKACTYCAFNVGPMPTMQLLTDALQLSSKGNLFYYDELLRIKAQLFLDNGNFSEFDQCVDDALLFSKVSNSPSYPLLLILKIEGENKKGNPEKALFLLDQYRSLPALIREIPINRRRNLTLFLAAEKSTSYYNLKDYYKALDALDEVDFLSYENLIHYGPDLAFYCQRKALYGKVLASTGAFQEGAAIIKDSIEQLNRLGAMHEKAIAYETLSEVYENAGYYKESLECLRSAAQAAKTPVLFE